MTDPFDAGPGGQQAFEALACAITCALRAAGTSIRAERARLIRQGFANLGTARDAAELMDAALAQAIYLPQNNTMARAICVIAEDLKETAARLSLDHSGFYDELVERMDIVVTLMHSINAGHAVPEGDKPRNTNHLPEPDHDHELAEAFGYHP